MLSILMQIPSSAYRVVVIDRTTSVEMPRATSAMVVEILLESIVRLMALALAIALVAADLPGAQQPVIIGIGALFLILVFLFLLVRYSEQIEPKLAGGLKRVPFFYTPSRWCACLPWASGGSAGWVSIWANC